MVLFCLFVVNYSRVWRNGVPMFFKARLEVCIIMSVTLSVNDITNYGQVWRNMVLKKQGLQCAYVRHSLCKRYGLYSYYRIWKNDAKNACKACSVHMSITLSVNGMAYIVTTEFRRMMPKMHARLAVCTCPSFSQLITETTEQANHTDLPPCPWSWWCCDDG